MIKKVVIFIFLIWGFTVFSLEIDEKLTLRILNVSSSKKTVLTNRGLEDGLVVGDHAKFFLTTGVIARGMVVKASPSRSIWSLYRLIDADMIEKDKVVKIKISSPVKLTEDPSKMLEQDDRAEPEKVEVVKAEEDRDELASLKKVTPKRHLRSTGKLEDKSWEIWGMVSGSMLSGTLDRTAPLQDSEVSGTFIDGMVGVEKYVGGASGFLSHVSATAFARMANLTSSGADGESKGIEYGLGVSYHFGPSTAVTNKIIWLAQANVGIAMPTTLTDTSGELSGSGMFMAGGVGMKYYMDSGFGFRAYAEYYTRSESYDIASGDSWSNSLAGIRVGAGLSYRF